MATEVMGDSGQALDLPPNRCAFSGRCDFGEGNHYSPFARASDAVRNCWPGYSWPSHLYQELSECRICAARCQRVSRGPANQRQRGKKTYHRVNKGKNTEVTEIR
jgi:hypothetical protein